MVGLSVVSENLLNVMPRSKTNANLKTGSQRRSSLQPRSPYFWNTPSGSQETPRKSKVSAKNGNSGQLPYRRKSTGETYRIWDLAENGIKNIRLIEMSDNGSPNKRQADHIFPPISSLRNPRLLSATPSARSERNPKRTSTAVGRSRHSSGHSKSNKSITNNSLKFLRTDRSNNEEFCHGLPKPTKDDGQTSVTSPTSKRSPGSKTSETTLSLSNRGMKPRASSLRSQAASSDGESNSSAAFRARLTPRRYSLPVTPSTPQSLLSRRGKEGVKTKEFSAKLSTGDIKSHISRSLIESSEKFSSPPSSTTARDNVPVTSLGDPLHIIEEMPAEPSTPVVSQEDKTLKTASVNDRAWHKELENEPDTGSARLSNGLSINNASEDYKLALSSLALPEQRDVKKIDEMPELSVTTPPDKLQTVQPQTNHVDQIDFNNNEEQVNPTSQAAQKAELFTSSSMYGDDESIIDATILNERDEDLCDADFREKRIIQWIISAETGCNVEQRVASTISPSPTNGSRETAITVIYGE